MIWRGPDYQILGGNRGKRGLLSLILRWIYVTSITMV
jgi:hypothetical protein